VERDSGRVGADLEREEVEVVDHVDGFPIKAR
jgi:hypothetical protein